MSYEELSPYTAIQRHPSQWCLFVPAEQMAETNVTNVTMSNDAMNLQSVPASMADSQSTYNFEKRYVVPEVIAYSSPSEADTRSVGNPYSHHPNFTTASQYYAHLEVPLGQKTEVTRKATETNEDVLTMMDIQNLPDPFSAHKVHSNEPLVAIHTPNDVTLNKTALTAESLTHIQQLFVPFPYKGHPELPKNPSNESSTLNKKMMSPDSLYELALHEVDFNEKPSNLVVMRDFSLQSLEDLRELKNISQYSECRSSQDVDTCIPISPSPYEKEMFEWSEQVAYGGI